MKKIKNRKKFHKNKWKTKKKPKTKQKTKSTLLFSALLPFLFFFIFIPNFNKSAALRNVDIYLATFFFSILFLSKILFFFIKKRKNEKLFAQEKSLKIIDLMSGEEFEKFLQRNFVKEKYSVKLTPKTGDYGADLILKKNKDTIVVQAKRYKSSVGVSAVQEVLAAKGYYNANKCLVVTNSIFTPNAKTLAKVNNVILWDRSDIARNFRLSQ